MGNKNLKVVQININYFSRFKKSVLEYRLINDKYDYVYFDGIEIWDLDVIESKRMYDYSLIRKRRYVKWGKLFSCNSIEEMKPILEELLTKKEVYIFMETVKRITRYYNIMDEKEALELDNKIRRSLYDEGKQVGFNNGFSDGIMNMIKGMIDNHIDIETISRISNKSIEEIDKIMKV